MRDNKRERIWGAVLLVVGILLPFALFALKLPRTFVLLGGPILLLIVFGVLMVTGRMPQPPR